MRYEAVDSKSISCEFEYDDDYDSLASLPISHRDHSTGNDGASEGCPEKIHILHMLVKSKINLIWVAYLVDAVGLNGGIYQLGHKFPFQVL